MIGIIIGADLHGSETALGYFKIVSPNFPTSWYSCGSCTFCCVRKISSQLDSYAQLIKVEDIVFRKTSSIGLMQSLNFAGSRISETDFIILGLDKIELSPGRHIGVDAVDTQVILASRI